MRKFSKLLVLVVVFTMLGSIFAGCGGASSAPAADSANVSKGGDKIVVGLSLPTQREERWVRDKVTMEAKAKELGIDLKVQVADNDMDKQTSQCENLISQGIKVLILAPQDGKAAAAIVDKAHAAGIKVISYDRLILDTDVDIYMSFDNVKVGELQGQFITSKVPKGNYIILSGDPGDNNAKLFKEGAMKYIKPLVDKGDIKVILDQPCKDWKAEEAMAATENALTKTNNKIDAILAPNDGTANGCIQALAAQGLAGKVPITGQDAELAAAQRIVEGTQSMTIFKDTRELGKAAIEAAIKLAKGEDLKPNGKVNNGKIDVPSILLTPVAVDKDNLDKVLIDSGYLKKEDVYKK